MPSCCGFLMRVVEFWDSFQVELKGTYSVDRLHALRQYEADHPSRLRSLLIAALVPVPCLVFVVTMDVIPLGLPSDGFEHQRIGFYVRGTLTAMIPSYVILTQFCRMVPGLTISTRRICVASVLSALVVFTLAYVWSRVIGFPVPFLVHIQSVPVVGMVSLVMWVTWKEQIRAEASIRHDIKLRVFVIVMQLTMLQVYFVYIVIFKQLSHDKQIYFTMLLPVIKLVFKNLVSSGLERLDDLAPALIVSHVDIFHTLFVTLTMQSKTSLGTMAFIMIIDMIQNAIALRELSVMVGRVQQATERAVKSAYGSKLVCIRTVHDEATKELAFGVTHLAAHVLASNPRVSSRPELTRRSVNPRNFGSIVPVFEVKSADSASLALARDIAQFELAQATLKLLHMTEFYVLVEFVEVVMATFYGTCFSCSYSTLIWSPACECCFLTVGVLAAAYLYIISLLPNRVYYWTLKGLTTAAIQANARVVAEYAAMELVSLVVFCFLVQSQVKHHSALNQLAFTLENHWALIQAPFMMWVFLMFNMTLDHYGEMAAYTSSALIKLAGDSRTVCLGTDTTFKFEWLKANKLPHA